MNAFVEIAKSLEADTNKAALVNFRSQQSFTAGELLHAVDELAQNLSVHLPKKKAVVAVSLANGEDAVAAVLALWQLGHAVMPLPSALPTTAIENIMKRGPASTLVFSSLRDFGPSTVLGRLSLKHFHTGNEISFPLDDLAFVRFTSGTTERARAVLISHNAILARAESFSQAVGLQPGRTVLWHLDMSYHFTTSIVSFLIHRCPIHLGPTLLLSKFAEWVTDNHIDLFFSLPFFYDQLATIESQIPIQKTQLFVTGHSISSRTLRLIRERQRCSVQRMYGVIEAGIPALLGKSDDPNVSGPVVRPYEIRISTQEADGRGRIEIKSPGFFSGYLTGDNYDYEPFDEDWFDTGDLGYVNSDGQLVIEGRAKELIILAGHKFFPSEIEAVINTIPGVWASAAFVAGNPQILFAAYASGTEVSTTEIRSHLRRKLEHAKIPEKFLWVSEIVKTPSGKIVRDAAAYTGIT